MTLAKMKGAVLNQIGYLGQPLFIFVSLQEILANV